MNKKKSFASGVNIGSSSILVTFVLLCLITFAALSFVSANADNKLATQTADRVSAYYNANNDAEVHLKNINSLLKDNFMETSNEKEFFDGINGDLFEFYGIVNVINEDDETYIKYNVPVSNTQTLHVTLRVIYPESANDEFFEITQWETVTEFIEEEIPGSEESGFLF